MLEGGFWKRLFQNRNEENHDSIVSVRSDDGLCNGTDGNNENTIITYDDALSFVLELQNYYYSDVCKMQTDLATAYNDDVDERTYLEMRISQEQNTLTQIEEIIARMKEVQSDFQEVWRKSVYSFYDEIEKDKHAEVYPKLFDILLALPLINTKPELDSVIAGRLEKYRTAWNIASQCTIQKNCNPILVGHDGNLLKYKVLDMYKLVKKPDFLYKLKNSQVAAIRKLEVSLDPVPSAKNVWVHISSANRHEVNILHDTPFAGEDWEEFGTNKRALHFDVVKLNELQDYIRAVLQIILQRNTYAVICVLVPTRSILDFIVQVRKSEKTVEIQNVNHFILAERGTTYGDKELVARVDRRYIPEKIQLIPFTKYRSYRKR